MNEEVSRLFKLEYRVQEKQFLKLSRYLILFKTVPDLSQLDAERSIVPDPDCVIFATRHDQRLPMTNIQTLDGVAVERIKQDGEHVPLLRTVIFLLH